MGWINKKGVLSAMCDGDGQCERVRQLEEMVAALRAQLDWETSVTVPAVVEVCDELVGLALASQADASPVEREELTVP